MNRKKKRLLALAVAALLSAPVWLLPSACSAEEIKDVTPMLPKAATGKELAKEEASAKKSDSAAAAILAKADAAMAADKAAADAALKTAMSVDIGPYVGKVYQLASVDDHYAPAKYTTVTVTFAKQSKVPKLADKQKATGYEMTVHQQLLNRDRTDDWTATTPVYKDAMGISSASPEDEKKMVRSYEDRPFAKTDLEDQLNPWIFRYDDADKYKNHETHERTMSRRYQITSLTDEMLTMQESYHDTDGCVDRTITLKFFSADAYGKYAQEQEALLKKEQEEAAQKKAEREKANAEARAKILSEQKAAQSAESALAAKQQAAQQSALDQAAVETKTAAMSGDTGRKKQEEPSQAITSSFGDGSLRWDFAGSSSSGTAASAGSGKSFEQQKREIDAKQTAEREAREQQEREAKRAETIRNGHSDYPRLIGKWTLETVDGKKVPKGVEATLEFHPNESIDVYQYLHTIYLNDKFTYLAQLDQEDPDLRFAVATAREVSNSSARLSAKSDIEEAIQGEQTIHDVADKNIYGQGTYHTRQMVRNYQVTELGAERITVKEIYADDDGANRRELTLTFVRVKS
jgi:hypothetical protein